VLPSLSRVPGRAIPPERCAAVGARERGAAQAPSRASAEPYRKEANPSRPALKGRSVDVQPARRPEPPCEHLHPMELSGLSEQEW